MEVHPCFRVRSRRPACRARHPFVCCHRRARAVAQKAFQRDDLADAAIKLEAQIKAESGPGDGARRGAAARRRRGVPAQRLPQRPADPRPASPWWRPRTAPTGCASRRPCCRSARAMSASARRCSSAPRPPPTSPTSAPSRRPRRPTSLLIISRSFADRQLWRPALDAMRLSLDLREVADVRQQYERMREDHGFRLLDYSVDADAASPRACFQFSEDLPGRRTDLSPFVAVVRPGPSGAVGRHPPALRRRPQARRALHRHAARRHSVDGARDAGQARRVQHLCARPQAAGALLRPRLCAAARRPARHSGREREHRRRWRSRSIASATATWSRPCSATTSSARSTATSSRGCARSAARRSGRAR